MFSELFPLLKECKSLFLKLEFDEIDPTKIIVYADPKHPQGDKYPGINQPIMLRDTPVKLDELFVETLSKLTPAYVETYNAVDAIQKALEDARNKIKEKSISTGKALTKSAAPAPKTKAEKENLSSQTTHEQKQSSPPSLFDNLGGGDTHPDTASGKGEALSGACSRNGKNRTLRF